MSNLQVQLGSKSNIYISKTKITERVPEAELDNLTSIKVDISSDVQKIDFVGGNKAQYDKDNTVSIDIEGVFFDGQNDAAQLLYDYADGLIEDYPIYIAIYNSRTTNFGAMVYTIMTQPSSYGVSVTAGEEIKFSLKVDPLKKERIV